MTDDEILAMTLKPGDPGYVLPGLRDPILQQRSTSDDELISAMNTPFTGPIDMGPAVNDDVQTSNEMAARRLAQDVAMRREEAEPGIMDMASDFASRVGRGAERVGSGASALAKGAGQLIYDIQAAKNKAIMDPKGAAEEAKAFAAKVLEGDPKAQEDALVAASMSFVPGVQDAADIELARRDVKKAIETKEPSDIGMAAVSTVLAGVPLVGVGLGKKIMKGAPDASEIAKLDEAADATRVVDAATEPVYESFLEEVVTNKLPNKIAVDDLENFFAGRGVSKDEIETTLIPELVRSARFDGKKSLTKDEVIRHLDENKVQIEEVRIPEAKAREEYVAAKVPGGENYQEVLLTYKPKPGQGEFTASHHAEIPNVMVHYRTTDRTDSFGRKILFVEEIQSDWHQKARKIGYKSKRSTTIPPEMVRLAGQVDRLQAQMDSLPVLSRPTGYFSRGIRMASRIDPSVPSQSRYLESLQSDNLYTDFALDWFESLKGTKDFENLSDTRKGYLREFAEFNELRNERLPLINELKSAKRTLVEASRNTPLSLTQPDPSLKISGKGYLDRLESAVAKIKRDGAPDAPFKKTSAWTDLALKRIFRDATDGGYDGVAFTTGDDASFFINMPRDSAEYYYDKVVPSRVAKMSKKLGADFKLGDKTMIDIPDIATGGFGGTTPNHFLYVELNAKAKQKAKQPQRLFEAVIGAGVGGAAAKSVRDREVQDDEGA